MWNEEGAGEYYPLLLLFLALFGSFFLFYFRRGFFLCIGLLGFCFSKFSRVHHLASMTRMTMVRAFITSMPCNLYKYLATGESGVDFDGRGWTCLITGNDTRPRSRFIPTTFSNGLAIPATDITGE